MEDLAIYNKEQFQRALRQAGEYLEMIREEPENKTRKSNDTLVNNQLESVRQATAIKIRKAEEIISKLLVQGKTEKDPIVRLHKGRIRNLKISMEERVNQLEQKRSISVGFNLVAGGIVRIHGALNFIVFN